jgi:predicted neutral ceramidase superfamily lipid hydrolase
LLHQIIDLLDSETWRYSVDTGWQDWDLLIYGNFWWSIVLQTVTEYHGGAKCLTRARLGYRYVTTTVVVNLIIISLLIYRFLTTGQVHLLFVVPYVAFLIFLAFRAHRLRSRVAELVDLAAHRLNMRRIVRSRSGKPFPSDLPPNK